MYSDYPAQHGVFLWMQTSENHISRLLLRGVRAVILFNLETHHYHLGRMEVTGTARFFPWQLVQNAHPCASDLLTFGG